VTWRITGRCPSTIAVTFTVRLRERIDLRKSSADIKMGG
jgi:hypothetical protein